MTVQLDTEHEVLSGAEAIWAKAADWLALRNSGEWTSELQAELECWLSESSSHLLAYWRVEAAWQRTDRLAALRAPMRLASAGHRSRWGNIIKSVAAVVAISTLVGFGMFYSAKPVEKAFETKTGGRQIVTMADGSTIELNTNTRLRLLQSGNERQVTLERGEAYFQIRHNAANPFVVIAGSHRVTDLGTKFVVRRLPSELKVTLLEGSARVDANSNRGNSASVTLTPGDVAIASGETLAVTKKGASQLKDDLAWRRGLLVFRNASLAAAASELNRYNTTQVTISDAATAQIAIGGTFPAADPAAFARVAHELLGLHVADHGTELVISN